MSQNEARGVRIGRPRLVMPEGFSKMVRAWRRGKCTALEAARELGVSRSTFFRRVRELERERGATTRSMSRSNTNMHLSMRYDIRSPHARIPSIYPLHLREAGFLPLHSEGDFCAAVPRSALDYR